MINYHSKNWFEALRHFQASYVIRKTMRMCLKMGIYAAVIVGCNYAFQTNPDLQPLDIHVIRIDPGIFSLLGIFLSLMLVFRTNTAYDRWWEGRKQWGALINHTRGLAVLWHGMLGRADHVNRRFFAKAISSYSISLSDHLRNFENHSLIPKYSSEPTRSIESYEHVPNKIVRDMYERTESLYKDGFIDGFQLNQVQPELQEFLNIQGACERIKATPIPFAHNFFIKWLIILYNALLPFVLTTMLQDTSAPEFQWVAIIVTMVVAYAMVGIEYISVEIEEPFGLDCNDLPTHNLALKIEKNVHEILEVEFVQEEKEEKEVYVVIN